MPGGGGRGNKDLKRESANMSHDRPVKRGAGAPLVAPGLNALAVLSRLVLDQLPCDRAVSPVRGLHGRCQRGEKEQDR